MSKKSDKSIIFRKEKETCSSWVLKCYINCMFIQMGHVNCLCAENPPSAVEDVNYTMKTSMQILTDVLLLWFW